VAGGRRGCVDAVDAVVGGLKGGLAEAYVVRSQEGMVDQGWTLLSAVGTNRR
jgi:hypothetical protein